VDKVAIATAVADRPAQTDVLDLTERLEALADFIRST
jgi:hypothetical protein